MSFFSPPHSPYKTLFPKKYSTSSDTNPFSRSLPNFHFVPWGDNGPLGVKEGKDGKVSFPIGQVLPNLEQGRLLGVQFSARRSAAPTTEDHQLWREIAGVWQSELIWILGRRRMAKSAFQWDKFCPVWSKDKDGATDLVNRGQLPHRRWSVSFVYFIVFMVPTKFKCNVITICLVL